MAVIIKQCDQRRPPLKEKLYGDLATLKKTAPVVRLSHWRGHLEEAIEEEEDRHGGLVAKASAS